MGTVMLARAILGGDAALSVLGRPPAGGRFRRLDNRFYRPLTAVLGVLFWLAARERHGR
ncbi:hypothetical protein CVS54_00941 [Microbacterium oxydans]|uniref:DUF3995 domain-containing protein n=1 Tax=Microbacterium oxydans TaxID=82380 RepID=A0A3Q9J2E2_9MICO|nr:hypothetical protein CVS54_00941 [Microbacterium oxydans]